jgi:hypothetical protein
VEPTPTEPAAEPAPVEPPALPAPAPVEPPVAVPPAEAPAPVAEPSTEDPFSSNDRGGMRLWTDVSGKYQVEATFVSFFDGTVRLKKSNGRYCRILLPKLSPADQEVVHEYVESLATAW